MPSRRGHLTLRPDQAVEAFAKGATCFRVLSIVHDTLELNYYTKLLHQTICFERRIVQHGALYKCRLLLFDDPALEDQPRHEVAVTVGRNVPVAHDTIGPGARLSGVHRFEGPVGTTAIIPNK